MENTMKIAVKVTIEVTPEQVEGLANEYGLDCDAASIRKFAKEYIENQAQQAAAGEFWTATVQ
jgi:hypothetical protein